MLFLRILAVLTITGCAHGNFQVITLTNSDAFLSSFRGVLLDLVAVSLNLTVAATENLNLTLEECKPKLETVAAQCKACVKDVCQKDPTFEDYLKLANPYLYLEGPLDNIGNKIEDAIDLVGDKASGFYNSVKNLGESLTVGGLEDAFKDLSDKLNLDVVANFFENAYNNIINLDDLIGDIIGDILGKKRRKRWDADLELRLYRMLSKIYPKMSQRATIDPEVRQCMEQCAPCAPLLKSTQAETVTAVCGPEIAQMNASIYQAVLKMQTVYNNTLDKENQIVTELKLNQASLVYTPSLRLTEVYINAYMKTGYESYQTDVPYELLDVTNSAKNMAVEYWHNIDALL